MDSMFSLMDLIILAAGAYVLYSYYLLKTTGEIKEGIFLPKDTDVKKCKDKDGYIRAVSGKVLIYGISVMVCGALGVLETQTGILGNWYLLLIAAFLGVTIWFAKVNQDLVNEYWPQTKKKGGKS